MQPFVDPGVLLLLTAAADAQVAAYQPRKHTMTPADRFGQAFHDYVTDKINTGAVVPWIGSGGTNLPNPRYIELFGYSAEALLPGGEALDDLGWSTLKGLDCGMPPWSSLEPAPYKAMAAIAKVAGWADSDMDRLAMWYVETGGQFITYDRCRAFYSASRPGEPDAGLQNGAASILFLVGKMITSGETTTNRMLIFVDGDSWSGRVWPDRYLIGPSCTRDFVTHWNAATCLVLAPIGIRPDGEPLGCLNDPTIHPYLASLGVQSAADLCTPGTGARLAQLAFEACLASGKVALLRDFTIGPEREWFGNFTICGGPLTTLTTLSDVIKFYVPESLIDYFNTVRTTRWRPSFKDLNLSATSGDPLNAAADTVAKEYMKAIGPERCLPVSERIAPALDYSYFRFLRDMLHDGPGYAGFRPWPTFTIVANSGPDFQQISAEVGAGLAMLVSIVGTAYTGGALSPAIALAGTLIKQAFSIEQTVASLVNGIGWNNGSWHSYAGLSNMFNSTQANLTKLSSQTMSFINGAEQAPAAVGAALVGTTVTVGGTTVTI